MEETRMRSFSLYGIAVGAVALLAAAGMPTTAVAQSTWEQLSKTGKLRVGVTPGREPYMWVTNDVWRGFSIDMGKQIAEALENENALGRKMEIEYVPTTFATVVLDMQSNKVDVYLGMSITEERKKAIDMYGPLYALAHVYINRKDFSPGENWTDYSKPEIKIASTTGTTDEAAGRKLSPNATFLSHREQTATILAVQAGHADAMVTSVLAGLDAMKKNPNFARMVIPKPAVSLPSGGGTRKDNDGRFTAFLQGWAYMSRASGNTKKLILNSTKEAGLNPDLIPAEMEF
jgi:polar amino acid transport system substrate-binding protein